MYSRDFEGIKSEGQLYNMEQEYNRQHCDTHSEEASPPDCHVPIPEHEPKKPGLSFLKNLEIDDLILIGIGILLLLDSDEENDILILIIALLFFF